MKPKPLLFVLGVLLLVSPLLGGQISATRMEYVDVTLSSAQNGGTTRQTVKKEVVWFTADGKQRQELYDGNGKVISISIYDPASQDAYVLHMNTKTAGHLRLPSAQSFQTQFGASTTSNIFAERVIPPVHFSEQSRTFLGIREISGLKCRGNALSGDFGARLEAWGCPDAATGQVVFGSMHATLPGGVEFRRDLNSLDHQVKVDSSIFEVPPDFRVVEGAQ